MLGGIGMLVLAAVAAAAVVVSGSQAAGAAAAGPSDTVVLRNLYLTGLGAVTGINFAGGQALHVEGVAATGFAQNGLGSTAADASLFVTDSVFRRNSSGVHGVSVQSGSIIAIVDSLVDGNGTDGVTVAGDGSVATLTADVLSNNAGVGLTIAIGTPVARIGASTVTGNAIGLQRNTGTLETFGDNVVRGNTVDTAGTITAVGKT